VASGIRFSWRLCEGLGETKYNEAVQFRAAGEKPQRRADTRFGTLPDAAPTASDNVGMSQAQAGENAVMRTGWAGVLTIGLLALACLLPGCTTEQILIGQWYTIDTPPAGDCPQLTWKFVVDPQRSIGGSLLRRWQKIATLAGRLNSDDSFQMTATSLADHRTASVTGQFTSQVSTIAVHGDAAGSACDGQVFRMRLGGYFMIQGGGGGGD
jgi:hypothetical protein